MDWRVAGGAGDPTTNLSCLTEESQCSLAKYLNHNPSLYHCPADTFLSSAQVAAGWQQRARSVSMNYALGDGLLVGPWFGFPKHNNLMSNLIYGGDYHPSHFFLRTTDLVHLPPSMAFVFIDEHPDSIRGPEFQTAYEPPASNASTVWRQLPASYHVGGCTPSYADGHAEYKKWLLPQTRQPVTYTGWGYPAKWFTDRRDILWLAMRMLEPEAL